MRNKQKIKRDLVVIFLASLVPMIIYLVFEQSWRAFNQNGSINFWYKFVLQSLIAYCLAGLGFTIVMLWRKEGFSSYGLVKKNTISSILMSILVFLPHLVFLVITKGFHGYAPMSGAIIYDSIMDRPFLQRFFCMIVVFLIWGFCEGFTYVFVSQKINSLLSKQNRFLNVGAVIGGIICVMMHGGIALNVVSLFDALTMFIFVYGILTVKDINKNAWGCIFAFLFLWNAFP